MRRGLLWGCVLLGCSFETTPSGADPATDSSLGGATTSGTTADATGSSATPQTGTGASNSMASGDVVSGASSDSSDSADPSTTSTTTTDALTETSYDPSSSSGGGNPMLSDVGLVARYFLDEAASGTVPTLALDSAEEPFPLPLEYDGETTHYASAFGHRGLAFDDVGADGGARAPIAGSKFANLQGATELTFEVVVRLDDAHAQDSRLVHIGRPDRGTATLGSDDPDELQFVWNNTIVRQWDYTAFNDGVAHVVHAIVDTNAGNEASRFRLLVDGAELTPVLVEEVGPGEPADVPDDAFLALGNRDQDRAMQGIIFYVAVYGVALSDAAVASHVPLLQADDDGPR
ncbi:MAG: hypothetical protein KUG77_00400 [Nannocystaceae bacterium]|nr:hypothetical protein [Nannocystaceae bacterium]